MTANTPELEQEKNDLLIRGSDYMSRNPGFKLVGRDEELLDLQTILMRKDANGVLLTGPSGVGMTALCYGLQASKSDLKTPLDIVNTRIFWLDTDKLFESGNASDIQKKFEALRIRLKEDPQTVLVVENAGNFIESARNNGCTSLINGLLGDIKKARYQCILEAPYEDIGKVLKCDSEMRAEFTLMEVKEPKADALRQILKASAKSYEAHHGIRISPEAIETAATLSEKYRTKELQAQPTGALTLIDRALAAYRIKAHSEPFQVTSLQAQLKAVDNSLESGKNAPGLEGQSRDELQSRQAVLQSQIIEATEDWNHLQTQFRKVYQEKSLAESDIVKLEERIEAANKKDKAAIDKVKPKASTAEDAFDAFDGFSDVETPETTGLRERMKQRREAAGISAAQFKALEDKVNRDLLLTSDHVLATFSKISGIPVSKLTQDARDKLLNLDKVLASRVFGQDHAVTAVSDAIRVAKMGLQDQNKPQAAFMMQGPSGVGKTEIIKALATALFDDENSLIRLDMSEYMEKHSVSRLIGAPPGYAGFEEGGELTNAMERNPNRIIMVDEIEKAHPDVFNVFLQILDDARVTSGKGITSRFDQTVIIMTTNVGAEFFLDKELSFEEASKKGKDKLLENFRNEFLNRFQGKENILGFKSLSIDTLNRIALREINKLNEWIKPKGLSVVMSPEDIMEICSDRYDPMNGARAIPGYFTKSVRSKVAKVMLEHPERQGALLMSYDIDKRDVILEPYNPVANSNDPRAALNNAAALRI